MSCFTRIRHSMRRLTINIILLLIVFTFLFVNIARADSRRIVTDGLYADWAGLAPLHTDTLGDAGSSGIDFGRLWVTNDENRLYMRFESGVEFDLSEVNSMQLMIDVDNNPLTGTLIDGLGVDFIWAFGNRSGTAIAPSDGSTIGINHPDISYREAPTVTATEFEFAIDRSSTGTTATSAPWAFDGGSTISLRLTFSTSGEDILPNAGQFLQYVYDETPTVAPTANTFAKTNPTDLRIVSHNMLNTGAFFRPTEFQRIFAAIDAEIICFQENGGTAEQTRALIAGWFGGIWFSAKNSDITTTSRYPILTTKNLNGNLGALIDLPDTIYKTDIYIINIHPPCCTNDAGRQFEVDNIIAWIRDLQTPGGQETLVIGTPIVVLGDTNFVNLNQQVLTLLNGDIQNEGTFGADHAPDWDGSSMTDSLPLHGTQDESYTWRNDGSSFSPGRLDYITYTDSVAQVANNFALWTPTMDTATLTALGLQANDTLIASDHLPVVADFVLSLQPETSAESLWTLLE